MMIRYASFGALVSVNHLHGITGLEQFDKALFEKLAKGN
jgi:hypothetical protein